MRTLAVLTNGGDTCALNASIKSIRDNAYQAGFKKIYGIRRGYQGLLDGWIDDITHREIDVRIGGSCLGSLRISPTTFQSECYVTDEEKCQAMAKRIAEYKIDVLVVIGGDGTLQSTQYLQSWLHANIRSQQLRNFEILGFLKTIDNDIRTFTSFQGIEVALCPGYPSAVNKIVNTMEGLRVTSSTAERAFAVEVMGRDSGWLAAAGTFGGAEILVIPELAEYFKRRYDLSEGLASKKIWQKIAMAVTTFYQRNRNVLISVAEGFEPKIDDEKIARFVEVLRGLYGPRKKVGATEMLALVLSPFLEYHFHCLSQLVETTMSVDGDLESAIAAVRESVSQNPKYADIFTPPNPLSDLPINEMLSTAIVLADRRPYKFEIRPHRTDYVPRSGAPSAYDYKLASVFGKAIGNMLKDGNFGVVPCLKEVVPYEDLTMNSVKAVQIDDIRTLRFDSDDFYDVETLQVTRRITDFFRTITTGPKDLDAAIESVDRNG